MSKTANLEKYELMLIVDAKLADDQKETVCKQAAELISKEGGKVINSQVWMERHKFTFRIKKQSEGTYYLINFESDGSIIDKVEAALKLNEQVLRFIVIKVD